MRILEAESFFRDPRARAMIRAFADHGKLSGNDLCEVMSIRYGDDNGAQQIALASFHCLRAHVSSCLYYFGYAIRSDGNKLSNLYGVERLK